jgi:hypothetical protein
MRRTGRLPRPCPQATELAAAAALALIPTARINTWNDRKAICTLSGAAALAGQIFSGSQQVVRRDRHVVTVEVS